MSRAASVRTQYLAFVVERATINCLLLHQSTGESPSLCRILDVDLLVSPSLAKSASAQEVRVLCLRIYRIERSPESL